MSRHIGRCVLLFLLCGIASSEITNYKRVCYYTSWSRYRSGEVKFTIDNVTYPNLCTHYIYAFAGVDADTKTIIPLEEIDEKGGYTELLSIKERAPDVKVLLALGGWTFGTKSFSRLANNSESINEFADNSVKYLRKWGFDGVDVDWEYPTQRDGAPEDRENFVLLLQALRSAFESESKASKKPRLLLTSAVPVVKSVIDAGYDMESIGQALDFINLMIYDLYGGWSDTIGHHAPLYPRQDGNGPEDTLNLVWGLNYWATSVPKEKLVAGIPLYGRSFKAFNSTMNYQGVPFNATATAGPYSAAPGILRFYEICKKIKSGEYNELWLEEQSVPYAKSEIEWVGYDNERSAIAKVNYVKDNQFGGVMVWELSLDDVGGSFCERGEYPIMHAIERTLTGSREDCLAGTFGQLNTMGCSPCPRNTYQSKRSQTSCLDCPVGQITRNTNSQGKYQCLLDCPSGFEYDFAGKQCRPCTEGYYRLKPDTWMCEKCPSGHTTVGTGSRKCVKEPEGYVSKNLENVDIDVTIELRSKSCSNKKLLMQAIVTSVQSKMKVSSVTWPRLCTEKCDNIALKYLSDCDLRRKRSVEENDDVIFATIAFKNMPQEVSDGTTTRRTDSLLSELMNEREAFKDLETYMLKYQGPVSISAEVMCSQQFYAVQNGVCAPCPNGSYYNVITSKCTLCGYGTYQEKSGSNFCHICPGVLSTKSKGSSSKDQCQSPCEIDSEYCKNGGKCISNQTSVVCQCVTGFEGDHCKIKIENPMDKQLIVGAAIGSAIGVLLIVFIIIASCACWRYSRRPRNYKEIKSQLKQWNKQKEASNLAVVPVQSKQLGGLYNDYSTLRPYHTSMSIPKHATMQKSFA